jgi:hypothetical protein
MTDLLEEYPEFLPLWCDYDRADHENFIQQIRSFRIMFSQTHSLGDYASLITETEAMRRIQELTPEDFND